MGWLRWLLAWLVGWLQRVRLPRGGGESPPQAEQALPPPSSARLGYRVVRLSDDPDELLAETLYAIGEDGYLWHVLLLCPCGCNATIALNALPDDSPRWSLHESVEGPSLSPSVWRTTGCRSHFILRRGHILWCVGGEPEDDGGYDT